MLVTPFASRRLARSRLPSTTASMLLKSCAMPPVSLPIASIFCACRSVSSARSRRAISSTSSWVRSETIFSSESDRRCRSVIALSRSRLALRKIDRRGRDRVADLVDLRHRKHARRDPFAAPKLRGLGREHMHRAGKPAADHIGEQQRRDGERDAERRHRPERLAQRVADRALGKRHIDDPAGRLADRRRGAHDLAAGVGPGPDAGLLARLRDEIPRRGLADQFLEALGARHDQAGVVDDAGAAPGDEIFLDEVDQPRHRQAEIEEMRHLVVGDDRHRDGEDMLPRDRPDDHAGDDAAGAC